MARRISNAAVSVEQKGAETKRRLSNAAITVEQRTGDNYRRLSNAALPVEWKETPNYLRLSNAAITVEWADAPEHERVKGYIVQGEPAVGTQREANGLSILAYQPVIIPHVSYNPRGVFLGRLDERFIQGDWSHTTNITLGFVSAELNMIVAREDVDDWIENGIGRHIELHNSAGNIIWEGFVDEIEIIYGSLTYQVGPLTGIGNIVNVVYTPIDNSVVPPTRGATTSTLAAADEQSIARYGVISKTLSVGECTEEEAEQYRDTWIAVNAYPAVSKDVSMGGSGSGDGFSIRLGLRGYSAFLDLYEYDNDSIAYTTISDKIKAVLAAEPNGLYSSDYTDIAENLFAVPESEPPDKQRMAWDVIKSLVAIGDANDYRYGFGIYEGRKARYWRIPTNQVAYLSNLGDQKIYLANEPGTVVYPWDVKPGCWIRFTDLVNTRRRVVNLNSEPSALLIEEITYTSPWELRIRGGRAESLAQVVAKIGYNG